MSRFLLITILASCVLLTAAAGLAQPDAVETNTYPYAVAEVEVIRPGGGVQRVRLAGIVEVRVAFEGPNPGDTQADSTGGLEGVPIEILSLDLTGHSNSLGSLRMTQHPAQPSTGQLTEHLNTTLGILDLSPYVSSGGAADCFFDVFFELEIMNLILHNTSAHRVEGDFTHNPANPGDILTAGSSASLFNEIGEPTETIVRVVGLQLNPTMEIDEFREVTAELDLMNPLGAVTQLNMTGTATIAVWFEGDMEGIAFDDDGDGLDEVQTELVALSLTGVEPNGDTVLWLSDDIRSEGEIEERLNNIPSVLDLLPFADSGTANSFFDIYFVLDHQGMIGTNSVPSRNASIISFKPALPGDVYVSPIFLALEDPNGQPTGWSVRFTKLIFGPLASPADAGPLPKAEGIRLSVAPNPFNPRILISLQMDQPGTAALRVFDVQGRLIRTLHQGWVDQGDRSWFWDGRSESGLDQASGVYFLRIETPAGASSRKVMLVR